MRLPFFLLALAISTRLLFATEPGAPETVPLAFKAPDSIPLLSSRGDSHLFAERFAEAVADFEKMIALDPGQDAPHWRLGIAYYFAGDFEKSARQFEKYHAYDGRDRENGIWKFLADARRDGIEKARGRMLVYSAFDREPFPALYEMLAGKKSGAEVLAEMERKELSANSSVQFFAHYYIGLHEELLGHHDSAAAHLEKAVTVYAGQQPSTSASYMWKVARLHAAAMARENALKAGKK
ncbi:MAG: hypothetical protein V4710_09970 [Verrucomicrobiota bacterium]